MPFTKLFRRDKMTDKLGNKADYEVSPQIVAEFTQAAITQVKEISERSQQYAEDMFNKKISGWGKFQDDTVAVFAITGGNVHITTYNKDYEVVKSHDTVPVSQVRHIEIIPGTGAPKLELSKSTYMGKPGKLGVTIVPEGGKAVNFVKHKKVDYFSSHSLDRFMSKADIASLYRAGMAYQGFHDNWECRGGDRSKLVIYTFNKDKIIVELPDNCLSELAEEVKDAYSQLDFK